MARRFIAGAVCPDCGIVDRITLDVENSIPVQRCEACGFQRDLKEQSNGQDDGVLPVKLIDSTRTSEGNL